MLLELKIKIFSTLAKFKRFIKKAKINITKLETKNSITINNILKFLKRYSTSINIRLIDMCNRTITSLLSKSLIKNNRIKYIKLFTNLISSCQLLRKVHILINRLLFL